MEEVKNAVQVAAPLSKDKKVESDVSAAKVEKQEEKKAATAATVESPLVLSFSEYLYVLNKSAGDLHNIFNKTLAHGAATVEKKDIILNDPRIIELEASGVISIYCYNGEKPTNRVAYSKESAKWVIL